jgi:hypothetical protein
MGIRIQFQYLNHNGKLSERDVEVEQIEFHYLPSFGYQPGWFISGFDYDKAARRSFALNRIVLDTHPSNAERSNAHTVLLDFRRASVDGPKEKR